MKIKKLFVGSFGKLSEREFEFSDKINVVYGKNEAGKSTLSAFVKYILFGFSGTKTRSISSNDKTKYMSWNGSAVMGSAELDCDGSKVRIERTAGAKTSLRVTKNGAECYFGKEPGEEFLGVDEGAFSRMAFIAQSAVKAENMSSMSDSVQNIVFAADETVDVEKARKKLSDFRNFYRSRTRKTGKCFELENKIRELKYDFDRNSELHKILLEAQAKLTEIKLKIKSNNQKSELLEKELLNISANEAKEALDKIEAAKTDLDDAAREVENAKKALMVDDVLCDESVLTGMIEVYRRVSVCEENLLSAQKNFEKAHIERPSEKTDFTAEIETAKLILKKAKKINTAKSVLLGFFALFAVSFIVSALGVFAVSQKFLPLCAALLVLAVLFAVLCALKAKKVSSFLKEKGFSDFAELLAHISSLSEKKKNDIPEKSASELFADELRLRKEELDAAKDALSSAVLRFSSWQISDAGKIIVEIKGRLTDYSEKRAEHKRLESVYQAYLSSNDTDALYESVKNFTGVPTRDKKTVLRELDFFKKANENLAELEKQYIKQAASPASTIRKPSEIFAERQATESLLEDATLRADSADLALEALEAACDDLKSGISPMIAKKAGELFSAFTDGKYKGLEISSEFGISVICDGVERDCDYLSAGTRDAAYLALRIALCETLFKQKPTLVFDEVFAHFDDTRIRHAMSVLNKLSENYQILIFTCHEREIRILSEICPENVKLLNM